MGLGYTQNTSMNMAMRIVEHSATSRHEGTSHQIGDYRWYTYTVYLQREQHGTYPTLGTRKLSWKVLCEGMWESYYVLHIHIIYTKQSAPYSARNWFPHEFEGSFMACCPGIVHVLMLAGEVSLLGCPRKLVNGLLVSKWVICPIYIRNIYYL